MRRGFASTIILFVLIAVVASVLYYIFTNYSKIPNDNTQKTAKSIYKYPNATTWVKEDSKNVCFFATNGCTQPVRILFETPNEWSSIYNYYVPAMTQAGWQTNSSVVTSIPLSVVFTRVTDGCKATLENHNELKYSFTISCPN